MRIQTARTDRRSASKRSPWTLICSGNAAGAGSFVALQGFSGRTIRLAAKTRAAAAAQVELLNRHSIEFRA